MTAYDFSKFESDCRALRKTNGPECAVAHLYASMSSVDRAHVKAVIDNPEITARAIATALTRKLPEGTNIPTVWTIRHHRRGDCKCRT